MKTEYKNKMGCCLPNTHSVASCEKCGKMFIYKTSEEPRKVCDECKGEIK